MCAPPRRVRRRHPPGPGVAELLPHQVGGVGVGLDVLRELLAVREHVVDDTAEEGDIGSRADRHVVVGQRAGAGEARVDMDDARAARLGLHHPLEAHGVGLGEVGALDHDAVRVLEVLHERGGATASEGGAEPGHGGAVADPRLVLDAHHTEAGEQLLDEVVLLVVQGGAAEAGDAHGAVDGRPAVLPLPGFPAGADHPVRDHVHGGFQVEGFPLGPVRPAVQHLVAARGAGGQLEGGRTLGAESPAAHRRVGVTLDLHDPLVLDVHLLSAADGAVRAHRLHHPVRALGAGLE